MLARILKEELEKISLSDKETGRLNEIANEIINKISKEKIRAIIGGSLAKSTLVRRNIQDIDIFVVFENEEDTKKLEKILKNSNLKFKKIHGSRDYFQINIEKQIILEIIPVVKISKPEKVKNVTDFSLEHVNYIKTKINKNSGLADEIKLAKTFCYAQDCYGAESYIRGFSGYALELLVYYFGNFVKFLRGIQKNRIIDIEKKFKNKNQVLEELNESKIQSPVILIDPTYRYRNVCAGLSRETFDKFLKAGKGFLKKPSLNYFEKQELDIKKIKNLAKKRKARFLSLVLKTNKQEGDIAGTKMKKFFDFMIKELNRKQQKILFKEFEYSDGQKARGYLVVKENKEIEIKGPPKTNKQAIKGFRKTRKRIFFKKGFAYAKERISLEDIFAYLKRFEKEMSVGFEITKD